MATKSGFRFWIRASQVLFFCTRKRPFSVILALPASYVFLAASSFLSVSHFLYFLISFFISRRPPPVINKPPPLSHRFLTFSHPSFSFPLPASDFFSFLEKPPPYEAVYDIFNFVVSFYADAILYPGVLSGRCIISQYQL